MRFLGFAWIEVLPVIFFAAIVLVILGRWLQHRDAKLGQTRRFPAILGLIALLTALAAYAAKAAWNIMNDPPGVIRPCMFCSPYVEYKSPPPPEPSR